MLFDKFLYYFINEFNIKLITTIDILTYIANIFSSYIIKS